MTSQLQTLFDQAVDLQSQAKNIEALALYRDIESQGFTSSAIELNKALIFEKNQDWGRALSSIESAQKLARRPWLESERVIRIQKSVTSNRAYSMGSLGELTGEISKIIRPSECLYLGSIFLAAYFLVRALGFKHRAFTLCALLASLLGLYSAIAHLANPSRYILNPTQLRKLPLEESASKFNLERGTKVIILRDKGNFVEVERPGDFAGWIPKSALEEPAQTKTTNQ